MDASLLLNGIWSRWDLVLLSIIAHILIFGLFIFTTQYKSKADSRQSTGMFVSFIIALYAEMYGYPLTVYILSTFLGTNISPGFYPPPMVLRIAGSILIFTGYMLVYLGWREIYRAKGRLVTWGIYRYIRHPQYVGLLLMTLGQLVQWPTVIAAVLWPGLVVLYVRLSAREEQAVGRIHGREYDAYARTTGRFLPDISYLINKNKGVEANKAVSK